MSRIGIDARMYGKEQTGIGNYVKYLIQNLSKQDDEFMLFLRENELSSFSSIEKKVETNKVGARWYSWAEQLSLPFRLARTNCDLIHFTHFSHPILYPGRFVVTIHDLTPLYFPGRDTSSVRKLAYKVVLQDAALRAQKIIVPSRYTREDLIDNFIVDPKKVEVIYEGLKYENEIESFISHYESRKKEAFQRLSSNFTELRRPFIFYSGVWRYHKNLENLLDAFAKLKKYKNFKGSLVLGGGRKESDVRRIKDKIAALGLEDSVITPGFLTEGDLKLFYRGARVFVLPSLYEGFGLGSLEAASQGTVVACSKLGPLPEILGDGAVYFDPQDPDQIAEKVNKLLTDDQLVLSLLSRLKERLAYFSWREMACQTEEIYNRVLNDK